MSAHNKVTVRVAAAAAGTSQKAVEAYLYSGAFSLHGDSGRDRPTRRDIRPADIVRIALMARLVAVGFTTVEASEVVARSVDRFVVKPEVADIPWGMVLGSLYGATLTVSREPHGLAVSLSGPMGAAREPHGDTTLTVDMFSLALDCRARLESITAPAPFASQAPAGSESVLESRRGGQHPSKRGSADSFMPKGH